MDREEIIRRWAPDDAWHREHIGNFVRWAASVWWCGDPVCDCERPELVAWFENAKVPGYVPVYAWQGTFISEGDGDPHGELGRALDYLAALRQSQIADGQPREAKVSEIPE